MVGLMAIDAEAQSARRAELGWIADADTFGARLVLVRQRMGWSNITEAARQCGLHAESWRLWEQGRMPSRLVTIAMTIATRTGCDYLWLVHGPGRGEYPPTNGLGPDSSASRWLEPHVLPRRPVADHERHPTRPVRQTRPLRTNGHHLSVPVAV